MKIKTKILCTLLGMSLLVAFVGALAVNRQQAAAMESATTEAENVAQAFSIGVISDSGQLDPGAQEIITRLRTTQGRDVVLLNPQKLIQADANPHSVGEKYTQDPNDEIAATILDGKPRRFFEESSADHPGGVKQIVAQVQSNSGKVLGAVVLEYGPLYDELMLANRATIHELILAGSGSVLIALFIALYMGHSIARPLEQLRAAATGFASGRTDLPMPPPRKDEIGDLTTAFGEMVEKRQRAKKDLLCLHDEVEMRVVARTAELAEAYDALQVENAERKRTEIELKQVHQELLETSRQAGMAEVATAVLHNVGNVLNSVNVASACVADSLRKSKAASLTRVVAMLQEHETDLAGFFATDARGKQLPGFLGQLAGHLARDQAAALAELAHLQNNIEHIKEIVAMQQGYTKKSGGSEKVKITDLIEDTLRMNSESFAHHHVRVEREFAEVPPVIVEKHKVLQILVNLVRNAKQACDAVDRPDKTLTLRVFNGDGTVKVAVSDNGIGISPDALARIFSLGFTTKKDGHGFGLHSGMVAAKEMGGTLHVGSEGVGHGATFTLELPVDRTDQNRTSTPENHRS